MYIRKLLLATILLPTVVCAAFAEDWPQFRGPARDNISKEAGLLKQWPKGGPKLLWSIKHAGLGFSGPSIVGDVIYTMGARDQDEYALALNVADGKEIWATKLGPIFMDPLNQFGDGPRATPTVDGDHVFCLGAQGELVCLKRDKGDVVWRKNLHKDFGGVLMQYNPGQHWGYCESPLIDGDKLVCCPGGPGGWMVALKKSTGELIWRTTDLKDDATDSSVVAVTIHGVRQYINSTFKGPEGGGVAGIDVATGKVLWYAPIAKFNVYAVCATPVVKDDLVYVTAAYSAGCFLLQVSKDAAGKFTVKDLYEKNARARNLMKNETGGVVLWDGHIFGQSDGVGWVCQELKTGKEAWSEKDELEGKGGSLTMADGMFYLLSDRGEAVLLNPSTEGWQEKGRFMLPALSASRDNRTSHSGIRVWTHPVVANGRLYLRDQELLYCYAVK